MKQTTLKKLDDLFIRYPALVSCKDSIINAAEAIINCYKNGGKVITAGNGGSAADAEHIVGELMKGFILKRELDDGTKAALDKSVASETADYLKKNLQMPLRAISLVNQIALGTAFANDQAADLVFAQQILGLGDIDDVFIAISTSGNSRNIIYAAEVARAKGLTTIALTGKSGGKLKNIADILINAPETETYKIQELHLPIYHSLCIIAEEEIYG
ncbi:MAG: SIS domain-containing protein [Selenomonadaceae bacterium]|nr:SIS domain-containing protein [Selenomonadaceae bacterium]MBP3723209.1 SIS domain-containing protein [Selenomonadaceae bacterium]